MRIVLLLICLILSSFLNAQDKTGTSFSGKNAGDPNICPTGGNFMSEKDVDNLITDMLSKIGVRNRYIIISCTQIDNCQAILYKSRPYILYNPNFLNTVRRLNFSGANLPASDKDWETLTILAHELGHHVNNHLLNPLPEATQRDMELEADQTAGFIIYLMGASLEQAKAAYKNANINEEGSYTHPPKKRRLEAIASGYNDAAKKYPKAPKVTTPEKKVPEKIEPEVTTTTKSSYTDVDGNVYKAVKIGDKVWLTGNLNVSHFRNGDVIPEARTTEQWQSAINDKIPAWCFYNNDPANGEKYGKLYNLYAVNDPRGLAPVGLAIPGDADWKKFGDFLNENAGAALRSVSGWNNEASSTNASGFDALPGGRRSYTGLFNLIGNVGYWWSSTSEVISLSWFDSKLSKDADGLQFDKAAGFSVRCINK